MIAIKFYDLIKVDNDIAGECEFETVIATFSTQREAQTVKDVFDMSNLRKDVSYKISPLERKIFSSYKEWRETLKETNKEWQETLKESQL